MGAQSAQTAYFKAMKTFLFILLAIMMVATVAVLVAGLIGVARGGGDPHRSNALMRWRVLLQAGALIVFLLLLTALKNS